MVQILQILKLILHILKEAVLVWRKT